MDRAGPVRCVRTVRLVDERQRALAPSRPVQIWLELTERAFPVSILRRSSLLATQVSMSRANIRVLTRAGQLIRAEMSQPEER